MRGSQATSRPSYREAVLRLASARALPDEIDSCGRTVVEQMAVVVDVRQQARIREAAGRGVCGQGQVVQPEELVPAADGHVAGEPIGGAEIELADESGGGVVAGGFDERVRRRLERVRAAVGHVAVQAGLADGVDLQPAAAVGECPIGAEMSALQLVVVANLVGDDAVRAVVKKVDE